MRRAIIILMTFVLGILLASSTYLYSRYRDASAAERSVRANYAEAVSAIVEIQTDLNAIDLGEDGMRLIAGAGETEDPPASHLDQIAGRIADLRQCIERSREKIQLLENSLRDSAVRVQDLETLVAGLKATLAEKESLVALLSLRCDSLIAQVSELKAAAEVDRAVIAAQRRAIDLKRRELSTIYYLVGSKRELCDKGIVVERGGLFGIGKTTSLTATYADSLFTPLDLDRESVVLAPAGRVEVLSGQPSESYEIRLLEDQSQVRIVDRERFRTVRHLVIMAG